jgi:hypothetical protein
VLDWPNASSKEARSKVKIEEYPPFTRMNILFFYQGGSNLLQIKSKLCRGCHAGSPIIVLRLSFFHRLDVKDCSLTVRRGFHKLEDSVDSG